MSAALAAAAYCAYLVFWSRALWHGILWLRAPRPGPQAAAGFSGVAIVSGILDLLFFRRLFSADKFAWLGSWTFHASFLLVLVCHLRYVMLPVPACIGFLQPLGMVAGFVMPFSACLLLIVRTVGGGGRYVSWANYAVIGLAVLVSAAGVLMRLTGSADLVAAKVFAHGLFSFRPGPAPGGWLFLVHFLGALAMVPALPTHIIAAPLVTVGAKQREYDLPLIMHGP